MQNQQPTQQLAFSEEMSKFINLAFDDLVDIANNNNHKLFEELYYNRKNQCDEFYALMTEKHSTAQNVLIIGGAGVGKTSFMHKLLINCNRKKVFPIFLDYRKIVPRTKEGLLSFFLAEMEKYFTSIAHPIHTLKQSNTVDQNFQYAFNHLESITKGENHKLLTIFLDDFDYAENEWGELLKYFLPFSNSRNVSLVLSVRPPLLNAIDNYDDRFRYSYIRKARQITLAPISVENVISLRLAPVLSESNKTNKLYGMLISLFSRESELCKIAKAYGTVIDELPRFEYPLTIKHNTFMQRITSGDLRETFAIAYESLKYILQNHSRLESRMEENTERKIIGREGVLTVLFDNKDSNYKIINLHKERSRKTGNSLHYNILEGIKLFQSNNHKFYEALSSLGHSELDVDNGIGFLSSKQNKFFVESSAPTESRYAVGGTNRSKVRQIREYQALPKLDMYLEICNDWQEYIARCGMPGESVEQYL